MAVDGTTESGSTTLRPAGPAEAVDQLRELIRLWIRVLKNRRIYEGHSPALARLEDELFRRWREILEERGTVELVVREHSLLHEGERVYESPDRKESLAFLLFRDGVRRLSFLPGIEAAEMDAFLSCLDRARVLGGAEDDLVTLFWEQDFRSIAYLAVDELVDESPTEQRLAEDLASGVLPGHDAHTAVPAPGDEVQLDDLQPLERLPVEEARLEPEELDRLRAEMAAEREMDLATRVADVAVELAFAGESESDLANFDLELRRLLEEQLREGSAEGGLRIILRLRELRSGPLGDEEPVRRLWRLVESALGDDELLGGLLDAMSRPGAWTREAEEVLMELPDAAWKPLLGWLQRAPSLVLKRAVSGVLLSRPELCAAMLGRQMPTFSESRDEDLLRELFHLLRNLPAEGAVPIVQRLLASKRSDLRRDAALTLGHFHGERVERIWIELLGDRDPAVRRLAVTAILRSGNKRLAGRLIDGVLQAEGEERDLPEKRLVFAAAGRLAGEAAIPWFEELLRRRGRQWFASRRDQELLSAAAHGLRVIGSPRATELLRELASRGDRAARTACREELGSEES